MTRPAIASPHELSAARRSAGAGCEIVFWLATLLPFVRHAVPISCWRARSRSPRLFALSLDLILGYCRHRLARPRGVFRHRRLHGRARCQAGWGEPLSGLVIAALAAGASAMRRASSSCAPASRADHDHARPRPAAVRAANSASWLTGGDDGLPGVHMWPLFGRFSFDLYGNTAYGYSLGVLFVVFLVARRLVHSPFGLALRGIRENARAHAGDRRADAAAHIRTIYTIAAAIAGIAGALLAQTTRNRRARRAELSALGRSAGHADPGRHRPAVRRARRRHRLHGRARPVLRHQPAILVFLARPAAGRVVLSAAERHPGRSIAASCSRARGEHVSDIALATRGLNKKLRLAGRRQRHRAHAAAPARAMR